MEPETKSPEHSTAPSESLTKSVKSTLLFFLSGVGAGFIMFAVFGGIWQVNHFWWIMAAVSLSSGALAVVFRQNFQAMLSALLDDAPSI